MNREDAVKLYNTITEIEERLDLIRSLVEDLGPHYVNKVKSIKNEVKLLNTASKLQVLGHKRNETDKR